MTSCCYGSTVTDRCSGRTTITTNGSTSFSSSISERSISNNGVVNNSSLLSSSLQVICWGIDSLYDYRQPLLLLAFTLNLIAIICIIYASIAIRTTSSLINVGWASATTTIDNIQECNSQNNDMTSSSSSITIHVWLGLKGYYGECYGQVSSNNDDVTKTTATDITSTTGLTLNHSDEFCTHNTNISEVLTSLPIYGNDTTTKELLKCELLTGIAQVGDDVMNDDVTNDDNSGTDDTHSEKEPIYCSNCKDVSRNCISTLLSSATFGIFPLILTIRRVCLTKRERGLRLRTVFFSSIALVLGLQSFVRFHIQCIQTIPKAFSIVLQSSHCNQGQPFVLTVPNLPLQLYTGGKLVILAATFKASYFTLHLITPVAKNHNHMAVTTNDDDDEEEGEGDFSTPKVDDDEDTITRRGERTILL